MATLTASIGAYANQMIASGITVGSLPAPCTIDSETLVITGGAGTVLDPYSITRACFGTAAASHTGGASITVGLGGGGGGSISVTDGTTTVDPATSLVLPAGTLSNLGAGAARVGLTTVMIGPVHVKWNDAGVATLPGKFICDLPFGSIVTDVMIVPTVDWAGGSGASYVQGGAVLGVNNGGWGVLYQFSSYDLFNIPAVLSNGAHFAAPLLLASSSTQVAYNDVYATSDVGYPTGVLVYIDADGTPHGVSAGEADVYVIIATPAGA